jgi:chromosome partitioning protein
MPADRQTLQSSCLQTFLLTFLRSHQMEGKVWVMHTVALIAQKGGVGKTSLTFTLAVRAMLAGKRVAIVDTDPQASAANLLVDRRDLSGLEEPPVAMALDPETLKDRVNAAAEDGYDYCFIDTPAGASEMPTEAARLANIVLIACSPSVTDMKAMTPTVTLVRKLQKPAWFLINKGRSKGINDDCALQLTSTFGLPAIHAHISHWTPVMDAALKGLTVVELPSSKKQAGVDHAKAEFTALWGWLERQLSLPPLPPARTTDQPVELRS